MAVEVSVIIPAKLPEPYLPTLVKEIDESLSNFTHEILVQTEKGLGYAVSRGVERAKGGIITIMDADGSHSPLDIPKMIKTLSYHDVVVGSRYIGSGCTYDNSSPRKFLSYVYNKLTKLILGVNIRDMMSGFIVAKKHVFTNYTFPNSYKFMLPLYTQNLKFKTIEFPITFQKRKAGKSKASFFEGFRIVWQVLQLRLRQKS